MNETLELIRYLFFAFHLHLQHETVMALAKDSFKPAYRNNIIGLDRVLKNLPMSSYLINIKVRQEEVSSVPALSETVTPMPEALSF